MECGSTEIKEESDDEHGNNTDNIPTRTVVTDSNSNITIRGEPEEVLDIKIEPEESEFLNWSHINVEHNYSKIVVIKDESNLLEMKGEVDDIIPTSSIPASSDPTSSDQSSSGLNIGLAILTSYGE